MKPHLTNNFFAGNRAQLGQAYEGDLIVITANGLLQRAADSSYRFSQDANFWYLAGIDEPDIILVMDSGDEYLILPEKSDYQKVFDGSAAKSSLIRHSGVKKVYEYDEGWEHLGSRLKKARRLGTVPPPPAYVDFYGMYTNPARAALIEKLTGHKDGLKIDDLTAPLIKQRVIKQPEEIAALRSAIDITAASLEDAFKREYRHEYELEAEITAGFRRRGASGHAFAPIVAAGKRACTLHNVSNDGPISKDELVVVDVGAELEHYAADITRTVSFGRPSARQRAIYDAVLETQNFAIGLLRPGVSFAEYREQTDDFLGEKLRELGLIKSITQESLRKYYPHSISHFLGLNVHDIGEYGQPLRTGMVLTVEPGIYVAEEGIGVRIEDDILITEDGAEVLSGKLPRELR